MADPLAMVKVGNSACGFLKLTPLSRTSAIAGASSGVTFNAPNPSGMNRIRLWGVEFCANAMPADSSVRLADSNTSERCINISPEKRFSAISRCLCLVLLYDRFVTSGAGGDPAIIRVPKVCGLGMSKTIFLIPSYQPTALCCALLEALRKTDPGPIVVVDDGSGRAYQE